ncbi:hypothetical protein AXE65_01475 [Ventosimonas gracilis]|uniref:Cell division protein FtsL n=1 Tax=Ventosimonas gracilis TaxID=1680762 RepID=A0A139SVE6_9GAMM|nr:cell division protein FtsL [Ventosimonas gracilis]KXU38412.1 hypothetical protein AXE65_01475 [Ventosimonas gracilis]
MNDVKSVLRIGVPLFLLLSVLCSAIALPILAQQKKHRLNELSRQGAVQHQAQQQWRRLLLEQAALNAPRRIEQLAQVQLQMRIPSHEQVRKLMQ